MAFPDRFERFDGGGQSWLEHDWVVDTAKISDAACSAVSVEALVAGPGDGADYDWLIGGGRSWIDGGDHWNEGSAAPREERASVGSNGAHRQASPRGSDDIEALVKALAGRLGRSPDDLMKAIELRN